MSKHYDIVVLGGGIGALTTAALLARRSWRVLVLGQGFRPALYTYDGLPLARRPFHFLAASSPAWRRVLIELAQSQTFRRRLRLRDPLFQVFTPSLRLSFPTDAALFAREVDREFPEVRRVVDELYAEVARANEAADLAFEQDVAWPPGSFWERRETARASASLPYPRDAERDLLAEFPREHGYRAILDAPARFASDLGPDLPLLALSRLTGAWMNAASYLGGGEAELVEFLVDRIQAHGGESRLGDAAVELLARFGKVASVRVDGDDEPTGVQFVVTDLASSAVLDLASGYRPSRRALDARPVVDPQARRFVTSMLVRDEGVPASMASEVFLLPGAGSSRPQVHLQRAALANPVPGATLLVAEALVGPGSPIDPRDLRRARASVVATVESFLPFVERHYLVLDSPHDGLPLWDHRSGKRVLVDRAVVRAGGASLDAEPMMAQVRVDRPGIGPLASVTGEPLRYPLAGVFGVGQSALPGLGQEGQLLAAWTVARAITRTDRRKEKMRREMWSKVELG